MAKTYRAAICTALDGPASVTIGQLESRPLRPGEARIAVKAAGLNFPDLLMTQGRYQFRPDPPFVPGMELAGVIVETAPDVSAFKPGDRVVSGGKGGALADEFVAAASHVRPLPEALDFEEGACWSAAASTAWHALHDKAALQPGETLLVFGASGGVGMAAVKLAKILGATAIGTASTEAKRAAVLAAGADHAIDPADPDLAGTVKALTGGAGANVVFDPVGGELAIKGTRSIAWGGRFLIVGFASGEIPSFPANHAMIKGYSLIGLRAGESGRRDLELARRSAEALARLAAAGELKPHISHRFPLERAAEALRTLERREAIGRVVVTVTQ